MINTRLLSISLLASACISLPVAAQEKPYLGLDYSVFTYENSHPGASDAEPTAVRLRLGSVVAKYLAVEAQVAIGA
ncbi:MAG TPA: hypothetical protein PKY03_07545, partial [Moraxellaceae bacterium]|nr:hypothetical protein [Moraxellaceae bacterium]